MELRVVYTLASTFTLLTCTYFFQRNRKVGHNNTNPLFQEQAQKKEITVEQTQTTLMQNMDLTNMEQLQPQFQKKAQKLSEEEEDLFPKHAFTAFSLDQVFFILLIHTFGADFVSTISEVYYNVFTAVGMVELAFSFITSVYIVNRWKKDKEVELEKKNLLKKEFLNKEADKEKAHLINFTMKILAVSALLCAMMALTTAAADAEAEPEVAAAGIQGWSRIGQRYFRYITRPLTWAEAERNCISLGGHLASVHSFQEYHLIRTQITPSGDVQAWIGGSDIQMEGVWQWSDGSRLFFVFWCPGQPDNKRNQDCLQINFSDYKCWDDLQCESHLPSVCSRNN
ncbi:C-type lectin domain family 4 member F-like [Notolabrus celidotus]|uniref:C-type lectin domain family 4 member F-like n=1 Tax=Notolabrus celidotus TaxID=1203425 RepID=UPI0014901F6A|nr:C-type lectin domain family 4 member F-like [Notolabrus celidotus]